MCFEVILQIFVALFAVFGVFSLAKVVEETWFESDNLAVCLCVDSFEMSNHIEYYLREAFRKPLSRGGGVVVLVEEEYASVELIRILKRKNVRFYILNMDKKAV